MEHVNPELTIYRSKILERFLGAAGKIKVLSPNDPRAESFLQHGLNGSNDFHLDLQETIKEAYRKDQDTLLLAFRGEQIVGAAAFSSPSPASLELHSMVSLGNGAGAAILFAATALAHQGNCVLRVPAAYDAEEYYQRLGMVILSHGDRDSYECDEYGWEPTDLKEILRLGDPLVPPVTHEL